MVKKHQIGFRVDDEELALLRELSATTGLGVHESLRLLVHTKVREVIAANRRGR